MNEQQKYARIVELRDSGKTWWEISQEIGDISIEMCRYRYKQVKGLLKPKNDGMELRDYFAAKAMQGMATWDIKTMDKLAKDFGEEPLDYLARNAFAIADAMMKAREQ